jgi:GH24 family phage-related lysozyme (muramidase)
MPRRREPLWRTINVRPVPPEAVAINEKWEGFHKRLSDGRAAPYLCPAKVATIGVGTTVYPSGRKVALTDEPISRATARSYLGHDLKATAASIERNTTVYTHDLMFSALISFGYNCGTAAYRGSSLRYFVNRKEWTKAAREFRKWVNGGGRRLQGLVNRRADEEALFLRGVRLLNEPAAGPAADAEPLPTRKETPVQPSWWRRALDWLGLG